MSCGISYLPPSVPGGGEDLATTLTFGNTTGGTDISYGSDSAIFGAGQSISDVAGILTISDIGITNGIDLTAAGGDIRFIDSMGAFTVTVPHKTGTIALLSDITGGGGIYGGSGNLPAGTTTVTGGGNSLLMSGLGGFAVISTGAGSQFTDDDTTAIAELLALGSAFGVGEAKMRFDDTASGGGNQQISLGGDADIGGLGMIVTDTTGTPKGLINSADWSSNFVNESLVTKRYVDAQVGGVNTLYSADDALAGNRIVDAAGFNLTFDNVATFTVENTGSIVFNDTANIGFSIQRNSINLFNFLASSASNASLEIGTVGNVRSAKISQNRGILFPRQNTTQEGNITTPETGLQHTNTTLNRQRYYDGAAWQSFAFLSDIPTADGNGIYDGSGSLSGNTVVTMGGNTLTWASAGTPTAFTFSNTSSGNQINFVPSQAGYQTLSQKFAATASQFHEYIAGGIGFSFEAGGSSGRFRLQSGNASNWKFQAGLSTTGFEFTTNTGSAVHRFETMGANAGRVVINESGLSTGDFRIEGDTNANLVYVDYSTDSVGIGLIPTAGNGTLQVFQPESATAPAIYVDMDQATNGGTRKAFTVFNSDATYGGGAGAELLSIEKHNTTGYIQMRLKDNSGVATMNLAGVDNQSWINQNVTIGTNAGQNQNKLRVVGVAPTSGVTTFAVNNATDGNVFTVTNRGFVFANLGQRSDADFRWSSSSVVDAVFFDASSSNVGIGLNNPSSSLDVAGDIEIGSADHYYFGDPTTDTSWRIVRSGDDLIFQQREAGTWNTKNTISGA